MPSDHAKCKAVLPNLSVKDRSVPTLKKIDALCKSPIDHAIMTPVMPLSVKIASASTPSLIKDSTLLYRND